MKKILLTLVLLFTLPAIADTTIVDIGDTWSKQVTAGENTIVKAVTGGVYWLQCAALPTIPNKKYGFYLKKNDVQPFLGSPSDICFISESTATRKLTVNK